MAWSFPRTMRMSNDVKLPISAETVVPSSTRDHRKFTGEEYLFLERRADEKHEYCNGDITRWNDGYTEGPMMGMPKPKYFTEEEYVLLERASPFKSEYFDGEIFAMAGASSAHNKIASNLNRQLGNLLEDEPCFPMVNDMMVKVLATGLRTYPDVIVVCGAEKYFDDDERTLENPAIIMEIASDSTEKYDRTIKLRHYMQIPSLKEYIIVSQYEPVIDSYYRNDANEWVHSTISGLDATLTLLSLNQSIPFLEIYKRVAIA